MLAFERERAKWDQEKSYLVSQREDAILEKERFEKKAESLLRETEKLRNDIKSNRKN